MSNVNKVILVGNLGRDPELKYTPKGNAVTTISLATTKTFTKQSGERVSETCWHKASVWGKRAELCKQFLQKGSRVYIEGELQIKSWVDQEGNKKSGTEVLVDDIRFLGSSKQDAKPEAEEQVH